MFHSRVVCVSLVVAVLLNAASARADDDASRTAISAALKQWTADFNARRADKLCDLFARELRADFRGQPERGYDAQCALLQRSLGDSTRTFSYALAIKEILVWGDAAVVRLTWTLTIRQKDGGRDVSRPSPDSMSSAARAMAAGGSCDTWPTSSSGYFLP
jgi:ketosteroid isomerase-like protein